MTPTFAQFFKDVWGFPPYPWQSALADRVTAEGWPTVIDLPTGSGKTAVLDIALHHLVVDGGRTAPRRMVLIVDRRVIVDQAAERAARIRERIESGATPALSRARDALREMVGGGAPILECPVLRGGMLRDDAWARFPHVPVLAASTVDQVGSRLLFRGYGVTNRARPIHAGLMGCDTLFLLDEVHLARPFADLLTQLESIRGDGTHVPRRTGVVLLSATPGHIEEPQTRFGLTDADRKPMDGILSASKPTELETVRVRRGSTEQIKRQTLAVRAAEVARGMVEEGRRSVAVVVNRVDTARRVWSTLGTDPGFDRVLVTGRMRPLDQEAVLGTVDARVRADRTGTTDGAPVILVSTQSIEAGADFDFDGLVTECASLDALRQRFGRLDRRGMIRDRIGLGARAVVLARSDLAVDDAVYGAAAKRTWEWLQGLSGERLDLGISALDSHLDEVSPEDLQQLIAPSRASPVVMPVYLELWAQTNPSPQADPDVALFLHGIPEDRRGATPDVRVVWRADVTHEGLRRAQVDRGFKKALIEGVATVPPASLESLSLPVWTVRRWLTGAREFAAADSLSDAEGVVDDEEAGFQTASERALPVLDWRGPSDATISAADQVLPGATIVVPAEYGGIAEHGTFDPEATERVADLGDVAQYLQRGRPTLRMDDRVWPTWNASRLTDLRIAATDEAVDLKDEIRLLLEAVKNPAPASLTEARFEELRTEVFKVFAKVRLVGSSRTGVEDDPTRLSTWVLLGPVTKKAQEVGLFGGEEDDESFLDAATRLEPHLGRVSRVAELFAQRLHLPDGLVATLRWAGLAHDVGKIDPRFKAMLYGGDPVAARFGEPLAKSEVPAQDRRARERARALAEYARGQRHEMVSLDMIERSTDLRAALEADGADWDLFLHLVASHHGWARPYAPVVQDPVAGDAVEWSLDGIRLRGTTEHNREGLASGVARRFFSVGRRYGWHEVAYCEAILRLADHRVSEGVA